MKLPSAIAITVCCSLLAATFATAQSFDAAPPFEAARPDGHEQIDGPEQIEVYEPIDDGESMDGESMDDDEPTDDDELSADAMPKGRPAGAAAGQLPRPESVDDAARSLGSMWRFPWYDRARDDIQPVQIREPKPPEPDLREAWSFLQILGWMAIALVLAALAWLVISAIIRYQRQPADRHQLNRPSTNVERVEALPFLAQRSLDDLLGQARDQYAAGNLREAIILLFSYELVELDKSSLIRLAAGKTNRQYLREMRSVPALRDLLEQTMVAFEDVYFGGHELEPQRFDACWNRLSEFETLRSRGVLAAPVSAALIFEAAAASESEQGML